MFSSCRTFLLPRLPHKVKMLVTTDDEALAYPLTPVPASTATNVSLPLLPLAAALPFVNAQKTALPVKAMVRLVCLPLCVSLSVGLCQMSRATPSHPSSLHLWPLLLSLSPKWSSLCMDCLHGAPGLTVTLTTVSITSVTHTAISSVSSCSLDCFPPSQELMQRCSHFLYSKCLFSCRSLAG